MTIDSIPSESQPEESRPKVEVRFGDDALRRVYALIKVGEQRALLPASDLVLNAYRLAQKLGQQGVLISDAATVADIKTAAKSVGRMFSFRLVLLPGWCADDIFLHGTHPIGTVPDSLVIDPTLLKLGDRPRKFTTGGTYQAWRQHTERFATDQPLLTFLLSAALASTILERLAIQPFVLLVWGKSSTGKSSDAVFVGSTFGGDPSRPQHGFVESFKVTEAGIEKHAFAHNDTCLPLDEFSRVKGSAAHKVEVLEGFVDDFCAGVSKTRQTDALAGLQWSGTALITSNKSYRQLLADAGQPAAESMGPRLIELPSDVGSGHGIFMTVPSGFFTAADAANEMRAAGMRDFGHAVREFTLRLIEADREDRSAVNRRVESWKQEFVDWAGPNLTEVPGQLRDKLAGIHATGRLAKHFGVLPKTLNITKAVRWAWLAAIAAVEERKDSSQDPIEVLSSYIRKHRSEFPSTPLAAEISAAKAARMGGFRHVTATGDREYLIPKAAFHRATRSTGGSVPVMKALLTSGLAMAEKAQTGKYQVKRTLRPGLRMRVYCVKGAIGKKRTA